jgi:hypothetical protein
MSRLYQFYVKIGSTLWLLIMIMSTSISIDFVNPFYYYKWNGLTRSLRIEVHMAIFNNHSLRPISIRKRKFIKPKIYRLSYQQIVCIVHLFHVWHMPYLYDSTLSDFPCNISWRVQIMKFIIMQLWPVLCYFFPVRSWAPYSQTAFIYILP